MPLPQYCFSTLRGPGCSVPPLSSLPCCHHFLVHHHDCSLTEDLSTWPIVFLHTPIFAFKLVGWYLHGWPIQHHGPSISLFSFPVKLLQRVVSYCLYFPYSFPLPSPQPGRCKEGYVKSIGGRLRKRKKAKWGNL